MHKCEMMSIRRKSGKGFTTGQGSDWPGGSRCEIRREQVLLISGTGGPGDLAAVGGPRQRGRFKRNVCNRTRSFANGNDPQLAESKHSYLPSVGRESEAHKTTRELLMARFG